MDNQTQKPFSAKRWTDIPKPTIIGEFETTDEEKREYDKRLENLMRATGQLKPNEHVRNGKIYILDEKVDFGERNVGTIWENLVSGK